LQIGIVNEIEDDKAILSLHYGNKLNETFDNFGTKLLKLPNSTTKTANIISTLNPKS